MPLKQRMNNDTCMLATVKTTQDFCQVFLSSFLFLFPFLFSTFSSSSFFIFVFFSFGLREDGGFSMLYTMSRFGMFLNGKFGFLFLCKLLLLLCLDLITLPVKAVKDTCVKIKTTKCTLIRLYSRFSHA